MSTKKLDANAVAQLVANASKGLLADHLSLELITRIRDLLPDEEEKEEKPPARKKQFVVLVSDPLHKMPDGEDFAAWVLQIPEEASPLSTHERIETAAVNFNGSKRGRMLPVQTVGEALESIPAKALKEEELWVKTKTPVLVVVTRNEIPNTPGLFNDGADGLSYEIRSKSGTVRIDKDGVAATAAKIGGAE